MDAMKTAFVIFAALLLVQASFCSEEDSSSEESCVPGTTIKRDCNTCTCSTNGKYMCTLMGCLDANMLQPSET
ncbi:hypothetical protein J437_LFUL006829 [Ladona fulva]|uniref:Pacifastin domain-containing protein n=1 Tax=Ladona fulva TaxID=123851 RepID=A0A8K0P2H7_LADFU|nr:hypothetical protein J437_LFUL006829 [Ladona fulva]